MNLKLVIPAAVAGIAIISILVMALNSPSSLLTEKTVNGYSSINEITADPNLSKVEKIILQDRLFPYITGYRGAVFDGENVYFAPYYNNYGRHGIVIQYNTTQPFDSPDSWDVFNPGGVGFQGVLYHNDFVYYVPYFVDEDTGASIMIRYDTKLDFRDSNAWDFRHFLVTFEDGVVVGNHMYLSPHTLSTGERITVPLRYDTTKSFNADAAWEGFEIGLNAAYIGAAYDGKKIYYAPWYDDDQEGSSIMIYNTEKPFLEKNSWNFISIPYFGYSGAGFNGTHIVFAPCWCHGNPSPYESSKIMFLNVDTQKVSFSTLDYGAYNGVVETDDALYLVAAITKNGIRSDFIEITNSIKTFSPTIVKGIGYWGGTFDGRYVYFVPFEDLIQERRSGEFLRYDTTKPFEDDASWVSISFALTDFGYNFENPDFLND